MDGAGPRRAGPRGQACSRFPSRRVCARSAPMAPIAAVTAASAYQRESSRLVACAPQVGGKRITRDATLSFGPFSVSYSATDYEFDLSAPRSRPASSTPWTPPPPARFWPTRPPLAKRRRPTPTPAARPWPATPRPPPSRPRPPRVQPCCRCGSDSSLPTLRVPRVPDLFRVHAAAFGRAGAAGDRHPAWDSLPRDNFGTMPPTRWRYCRYCSPNRDNSQASSWGMHNQ